MNPLHARADSGERSLAAAILRGLNKARESVSITDLAGVLSRPGAVAAGMLLFPAPVLMAALAPALAKLEAAER